VFGISFGEILVITVVALIVIGPERLPKVARTLGLLAGRAQRYVSAVKSDIERELKADEIRRFQSEVTSRVTHEVSAVESQVSSELHETKQELKTALDGKSGDERA
jgi:sec-independent protein translocase protein TatB